MTEHCKSCDCILQRGDGEFYCNFCEIEVVEWDGKEWRRKE